MVPIWVPGTPVGTRKGGRVGITLGPWVGATVGGNRVEPSGPVTGARVVPGEGTLVEGMTGLQNGTRQHESSGSVTSTQSFGSLYMEHLEKQHR